MNIIKKLHADEPLRFGNAAMWQVKQFLSPIVDTLRETYGKLARILREMRGCMTYEHQIQRMGRLVPPRRGFMEIAVSTARGFQESMPPNGQGSTAGEQST